MLTWLNLLPIELKEIKELDFVDPQSSLEEGDNLVGDMTDEEKRLFTLLNLTELDLLKVTTLERKKVEKQGYLNHRLRFLREVFFAMLNENHNLWNKEAIGVRSGFKVVWFRAKSNDGPSDFLKFLQGLER